MDEIAAHLGVNPDTIYKWIARRSMLAPWADRRNARLPEPAAPSPSERTSPSKSQGCSATIRRAIIEANFVDCMVALPGQLFYSTQIPVYLWFCEKNGTLDSAKDARLFDGETELSLAA